jgi:hypothetical protein
MERNPAVGIRHSHHANETPFIMAVAVNVEPEINACGFKMFNKVDQVEYILLFFDYPAEIYQSHRPAGIILFKGIGDRYAVREIEYIVLPGGYATRQFLFAGFTYGYELR